MVLVLFHIYIYMQWSKSAAITRHWPDCHKLPSNQVLPCMVQCLEIIFSFFFYQHRMRNKTKTRGTWYTGRKVLSSTDSSKYVSSHIHVLQLFISKRTLLMVWEQLYNGFFFSESIKQTWTMTVCTRSYSQALLYKTYRIWNILIALFNFNIALTHEAYNKVWKIHPSRNVLYS